jgi:heterodisulfide reductase subunit C
MIDLSSANKDLWNEVCGEAGDIRNCFTCGTCVLGCPAAGAEESPLLIRSLVRKVLFGLEDDLLEDDTPWKCITCNRCEESCPMNVHPFQVIVGIRKWQVSKDDSYTPGAIIEIYKSGHTQALGKAKALRGSVGLEEVPPTIVRFPELLEKFRAMLNETELVKNYDYLFAGVK